MTVVADLQLWADNLETIQLPEIESDIGTLQVEVPVLSALITQKAQQFTDDLAAYAVTVTSTAATALQADDRSDLALTEIYALKLALEAYVDAAVAGVQTGLDTSVSTLTGQLATQILDDTAAAVAAEIDGVLADTEALAATATAMLSNANTTHTEILAATDLLTDTLVPDLSVQVDAHTVSIDSVETDFAALTTDYPHTTLLQGVDAAQAKNEADLAPLAGSILRIPKNLWGRDLETASAVLEKPTLNTYGTFHTDDADFGECFEFGDATNTNVGPAYPIDFDNNRVYKITATFKIMDADTWVHFGVTTQKGTALVEGYNAKSITGGELTAGTTYTETIYVGSDATALGDYGLSADEYILLSGSSTANKLYWFVEQNLTPGSGHIKLASLFITDVTEVLTNINALRVELQSNIDGVSATLTSEYYTAVETDSAIAVSAVSLQSNIDGVQANLDTEASTRVSEDTAIAADLSTLTTTVGTNTSAISSETVARTNADSAIAADLTSLTTTVGDNTAGIATESIARADGDSAIAADVTALTAVVGTNTADIISEASTRVTEDDALAADLAALTVTVGDNTSSISNNAIASSDADTALATDITNLTATVGGVSSNLSANYYTSAQTDSAITGSATTLQANIDAVSSTLSTDYYTSAETDSAISVASTALQSNIDGISSNLSTNYYTIAQADTAITAAETGLQSNIDGVSSNLSTNYYTSAQTDGEISTATSTAQTALQSNIDDVAADLVTESTTRANADSAISTTVTDLTTTVGTNTSSISTQAAAITDIEGNMAAVLAFRVKAGTAGAELELIAADDPVSGSTSSARLTADNIILDGTVTADHLNISQLDAIAADVGTITAGVLRSSDSKFVIDLDNKTITITV